MRPEAIGVEGLAGAAPLRRTKITSVLRGVQAF